MSVRDGLVAILTLGPAYGLQLHAELARRAPHRGPVNVGQIYSTLDRLSTQRLIASAGVTDAGVALGMRAAEWPTVTVISAILVLPAALVGVWAGRRGVLDDPERHRRLLAVWAAVGLPAGAALGDQKRVETPRVALAAGADHIVVGRPIWQAADPRAAARPA